MIIGPYIFTVTDVSSGSAQDPCEYKNKGKAKLVEQDFSDAYFFYKGKGVQSDNSLPARGVTLNNCVMD